MIYRTARHTNNLMPLIEFYTQVLALEILGSFKDHNNYDGVFLGKPNHNWHLEFTKSLTEPDHKFDADDILVFYPEHITEYENIMESINSHGIEIIKPENPYWKNNGVMIKDPDGYNIIISNQRIN